MEDVQKLIPFSDHQKNTHAQGGTDEDHREDDDDEDGPQGQQVGCQAQ